MVTPATQVLCLGEGMAVLHPTDPGGLAVSGRLWCSVGGAEANVAGALSALGVPTAWASRLGRDPFGDFVERDLTTRGVTVLAERDPLRPTGAYLKEPGPAGSRMHYYRAGSAATQMDGRLLQTPSVAAALDTCRVVHTSGITAGVLTEGSDLVARLAQARDRHGFVLSVDLNWRPALWRGRDVGRLRELLGLADVLLLGADEAEAVLGSADPRSLREQVGARPWLVVKSDAHAALEVDRDGVVTEVPALQVDVVEPVGAGDGFAAGYLAALLGGGDATTRLRLGHLVAASVLAEPGDHARRLPEACVRETLLGAPEEVWAATRIGPDGVHLPTGTPPGGMT